MSTDEQAIRPAVQTWMQASADGDLPRILALMDDDVVFLGPGRPAMRGRDAFAAASKAMEGKVRIEGASDIQEIHVAGDWAYVWTQLTIAMHPSDGSASVHRSRTGTIGVAQAGGEVGHLPRREHGDDTGRVGRCGSYARLLACGTRYALTSGIPSAVCDELRLSPDRHRHAGAGCWRDHGSRQPAQRTRLANTRGSQSRAARGSVGA